MQELKKSMHGVASTKIAVVHYKTNPTETSRELLKTIEESGHTPLYVKIHEIDALIEKNKVSLMKLSDKLEIDGGVVRSLGFALTLEQFFKRIGVLEALETEAFVINKAEAIGVTRDKWRALLILAKHGIKVPDTVVTENPFTAMRLCEKWGRAVIKPIVGSLGLGSSMTSDPDVAYHIARSLHNNKIPIYEQVFLEKPGFDFRVFVVGDNVIGAMKRVITQGWKTNIAQGAEGVRISEEEYPEVIDIAVRSVKALRLDYAGVDIAFDNISQNYYVLELNAFPQWRGLRRATGVDIAKHIIDYVIENAKR